jgi:hypothetical protein
MMKLVATALILWACAAPERTVSTIPVTVRSHNQSDVDVYLLCGDRDAEFLGVVAQQEVQLFEVPPKRSRCALGLNFFLVVREQNRGYWVGPLRPSRGQSITVVVEKYAGLSTAVTTYGT